MDYQGQGGSYQEAGGPPPTQPSRSLHYFIGIGIGLIPLILALLVFGNLSGSLPVIFLGTAVIAYLVEVVACIVCLVIERVRFIGYGLLTMVLATPVIVFIACLALLMNVNVR
jgi:hypothetical protein